MPIILDDDIKNMLAFKGGDEASFEKLLAKYSPVIINYIYRFTSNRQDAEDLTQEVFLKVYRSAARYEPKSKFSTWLYTIASNVCVDYKRKSKNNPLIHALPVINKPDENDDAICEIKDSSGGSVEDLVEQKITDDKIKALLSELPETQRLALTLKVYENKSYSEIAEILDCTIPAVESLIFRARQTLKKKL